MTHSHPADPPFLIMSKATSKAKTDMVINNLFSEHPTSVSAVQGVEVWNSVSKLMRQDLNKINALKNKNNELVLASGSGISYMNHLQIEKGEIQDDGWFIFDAAGADGLNEYIGVGEAYIKYSAARGHAKRRKRLEEEAMVTQVTMQQWVLSAPLQAAQSGGTQVGTATLTGAGAGATQGLFLTVPSGGGTIGLSSISGDPPSQGRNFVKAVTLNNMTQRPDQHLFLNRVTVWGDVVTTLPVASFWILRNDRSLGSINYNIVGASSDGYMTYHGGNIVCYVMHYNFVSAPQVVFCKEIGERVFAVISTYLCQLGYDCGVFAATTCPILTHVTCDEIETFDGNETSESQTTLELGKHVLADSITRPSCASLMIGEALFTDRLHHAYLWGDTACLSYKLFDSFDLTLTGTKWIQFRHRKSSEAYFLTILSVRLGNGAISPAVGIGICTINQY